MKAKTPLLLLLVAVLAGLAGWWTARHWPGLPSTRAPHGTNASAGGGRRILYYQSAMHPWIKSDKPGRCTICGMELSPVYEGEKGFEVGEGVVALGSNVIQVIDVQTDEVKRHPLLRTLRVAGTIEDDDRRHRLVSAYVDGRIDQLFVGYVGAEVVAGQPLATFYSPMLLAAERDYVTLVRRSPANAFGAEQDRVRSAARQRLQQLGLTEEQISRLPGKPETDIHTDIVAPLTGTVTSRFAYEGQYVKEGEKLFEIADFSTMWFLFDAYERDLAWLKPGQKVAVTLPAVPGKVFNGAITFIDPNVKDMTRSAKARVELPNPLIDEDGRKRRLLYHKLYADAVVQVEVPEVLSVVRSAVLSPGSQPLVYVERSPGVYEQRRLELGRSGDDYWEVLAGVSEGDRVVTRGNLLIDAQAQLNRDSSQPAGGPAAPATHAAPNRERRFTAAQQTTIKTFLSGASALAEALASDSLDDFNRQATNVHAAIPALLDRFDQEVSWQPLLQKIDGAGHLEKAEDLAAARKAFLPFSFAVTQFVLRLRSQPEFRSIKVYECPMVNRAVPGAPKVGPWMQLQGPMRNPYFGAAMLDCGAEVKP